MKEQTTRTPPKLRVLSAFLAVAMLLTLLPAAAFAAPAPESDFEYGASNGRAIIRKYKGAGGTVEIPATLGGDPVTGMKMQAFIECTSLKSVSMPESMTWIGDSAFAGCTGLEQVEFSPNLTTIGPNSFYACNGLTSDEHRIFGFFWMPETREHHHSCQCDNSGFDLCIWVHKSEKDRV